MTISEIAKLAGVSNATVSRYLNNGYVSADKKEKIKAVIDETGYAPSMQAQMLRTKKSKLIGVVLPKIDSESISRIVSGISSELSKENYELLLATTDNNVENELKYLQVFSNRVDGIIFIATILTPAHREILKGLDIPVVVVGQSTSYVTCIYHDDYHAAKALTELFIEKGRKTIGYIGVTQKDIAAGKDRYRGYQDAILDAGLQIPSEFIAVGPFNMESGYDNARLLHESELKYGLKMDALFCATDQIAVGAMKYFQEIGIRIPEDLSIAGFGHTRMSRVVTPGLTTVHFYYKTSGIEAARMILALLHNPQTPVRSTMLGYEIAEQGSI